MKSQTNTHALWITLLLAASLGLSGCLLDDNDDDVADTNGNGGGSGADEVTEMPEYTGNTEAAVVTEENGVEISMTGHQGAQTAIEYEQATQLPVPTGISASGGDSLTDLLGSLSSDLVQSDAALPTGAITVRREEGECGGEVTLSLGGQLDYQNYCTVESGVELVVNGPVQFEEDANGVRTLGLRGVTIAAPGKTTTLTADVTCYTQETPRRCYFDTNIELDNGEVQRIENAQVTQDESNGTYDFSLRIFDPFHGYTDVIGTGLLLCATGGFSTGNMVGSVDGLELYTIDFSNCSTMTLTLFGDTDEVSQ
ncbi:hypothetical protein [Marinimicrobium alkaliphilum]|uniref:hypothetical protein n=1 Tax=Marinimicrobium alkaliphilum TaxID=2202654 RepID=UPI000DB9BFC4|nr:hypothetical protein [Marinimicrobium alkaliphilum]